VPVRVGVTGADRREPDQFCVSFFALAQAVERDGANAEVADLHADRLEHVEQVLVRRRNRLGIELDHADDAPPPEHRAEQGALPACLHRTIRRHYPWV
jgi:hypothetical protein